MCSRCLLGALSTDYSFHFISTLGVRFLRINLNPLSILNYVRAAISLLVRKDILRTRTGIPTRVFGTKPPPDLKQFDDAAKTALWLKTRESLAAPHRGLACPRKIFTRVCFSFKPFHDRYAL